jgi:hypothetical protein
MHLLPPHATLGNQNLIHPASLIPFTAARECRSPCRLCHGFCHGQGCGGARELTGLWLDLRHAAAAAAVAAPCMTGHKCSSAGVGGMPSAPGVHLQVYVSLLTALPWSFLQPLLAGAGPT